MERTYWHSDSIDMGYPVDDRREPRWPVAENDPSANLVSSLLTDGRHAPALDMDLPCRLIPSSTPDHYHLLVDKPMSWWRYRLLLRALVWAGLIERKYYRHSVRRKQTFLRLPHIHKGVDYRTSSCCGAPLRRGRGPEDAECDVCSECGFPANV